MGKKNVLVRFRSAMGGFHKGDVTKYVVKLHEEYKAALAELEEKCAALTRENETLRQAVELERLTELENQNRELTRKLEALDIGNGSGRSHAAQLAPHRFGAAVHTDSFLHPLPSFC